MNRDDIIRMAREAFGGHALKHVQDFAAFAYDQGAAAEREACDKELQWYYETGDEDVRAMNEAQIVLQAIKDTEPGVYDEMIDNALRLIHNALMQTYKEKEE